MPSPSHKCVTRIRLANYCNTTEFARECDPRAGRALEHFPENWTPVFRRKGDHPRNLVLRFRGSNHIDTSINLVLRSALLRASRRTATSEIMPAAILRDGASRLLRMRSVGSSSIRARYDWFHGIDLLESKTPDSAGNSQRAAFSCKAPAGNIAEHDICGRACPGP
jgi:hypothetical protein